MQKIVIITGVSKGLGQAMAKKFMENRFHVIGFSRSKPDTELSLWIQGDINSSIDREKLISTAISQYGQIDILINNAGMGIYETWEDMKIEDIRQIFELNFFSVISLTQLAIPHLKKTKGTIINLCSVAGRLAVPYMGGYSASKFAIDAFSATLRAELMADKVNVLNVLPGRIGTGFGTRSLGSKKHPSSPSSNPEPFAQKVFKYYLKKKKELVYPRWYKIAMGIAKMLPGLFDKISVKKWKEKNI